MEILNDHGVFTIFDHIKMDFINRDDIAQRQTAETDIQLEEYGLPCIIS